MVGLCSRLCLPVGAVDDGQLVTGVALAPVLNGCEQRGRGPLGGLCPPPQQTSTHQQTGLESQPGMVPFSITQSAFSMRCNTPALFLQLTHWQQIRQARPLSSASWALSPPNSLRYQRNKQPLLSHPYHHASQPQRGGYWEERWEESLSVCVLVPQGESDDLHSLLEVPLSNHSKLRDLLTPHWLCDFSFPLTTVDGSREDDISVDSLRRDSADVLKREHGCFRSLFEAERCPAPFMYGSHFYCFHCPGTEPGMEPGSEPDTASRPGSSLKSTQDTGLNPSMEPLLLPQTSLCSHAEEAEGKVNPSGDQEGEEKLALMYERLRIEVR